MNVVMSKNEVNEHMMLAKATKVKVIDIRNNTTKTGRISYKEKSLTRLKLTERPESNFNQKSLPLKTAKKRMMKN